MSRSIRTNTGNRQKKMPSMPEAAGLGTKPKLKTEDCRNPYKANRAPSRDKTEGEHSRPGAKDKVRTANRAQTKRARQALKRDLVNRAADLSADGPYATGEDVQTARSLGISVARLRQDRADEDRA